jgi:hypothetical protein
LVDGFEQVQPVALAKMRAAPNLTTLDAWKAALDHLCASRKACTNSAALASVLARYAAWAGSTSGVERNFSMYRWAVEGRRAWVDDNLENDELKIICDHNAAEEDEVSRLAQHVWHDAGWLAPRSAYRSRIDKGIKRKRLAGKGVAEFVKRRRESLTSLLKNAGVTPASTQADLKTIKQSKAGWTDGHRKEASFLSQKEMSTFVDAILEGVLEIGDLDEATCEVLLQEVQRRMETERRRRKKVLAFQDSFRQPSKPDRHGAGVFVNPSVDADSRALDAAIAKLDMKRVLDRTQADIFVEASAADAGQRSTWACILRGGFVCTPEFILSGMERGCGVAYKAGIKSRRCVHMTQDFRAAHPVVCNTIESISGQRCSKWNIIHEVTEQVKERFKGMRAAELIVFATAREIKMQVQATLDLSQMHGSARFAPEIRSRFSVWSTKNDFASRREAPLPGVLPVLPEIRPWVRDRAHPVASGSLCCVFWWG